MPGPGQVSRIIDSRHGADHPIKVFYNPLRYLLRPGDSIQTVKNLFLPEIANSDPAVNNFNHDPTLVWKVVLLKGQAYEFRYNRAHNISTMTLALCRTPRAWCSMIR
jgi:hypothetical protein